MKRGRNQRRRPGGGNNPNRAHDSNGPDVRIRGTANQIYDKYVALARDASSSGDRVKAENYQQHAEHYFRVLRANQATQQAQQAQQQTTNSDQPSVDGDKDDANTSNNASNNNGRGRSRGRRSEATNETSANEAAPKEEAKTETKAEPKTEADDAPAEKETGAQAPRETHAKGGWRRCQRRNAGCGGIVGGLNRPPSFFYS